MTIRSREILNLAQLARVNEAWEKGKTLQDLAAAHGVSVAVLKARLRYYLGFGKTGGGMPSVHPKAWRARTAALKEDRLDEYYASVAALPMPECKSNLGKSKPYFIEWSEQTAAKPGKRKGRL